MDEKQIAELMRKLDLIIALLSISMFSENDSVSDRVTYLANLGFENKLIAAVLNISEGSVRAHRSNAKKG